MAEQRKRTTSSEQRRTAARQWQELGVQILGQARQELVLSFRQLFPLLARFSFRAESRFRYLADDARTIYFNPIRLAQEYKDRPIKVNRAFLHISLHALFSQCFPPEGANRALWDLASDISVEYIIDGLDFAAVRLPAVDARENAYRMLTKGIHVMSAGSIYHWLKMRDDWEMQAALLAPLFEEDDHSLWYQNKGQDKQEQEQKEEDKNKLKHQAKMLAASLPAAAKGRGDGRQRLSQALGAAAAPKSSYRDFLRKFMERQEELKVDPDSFDYGYYQLGLDLYGNTPLFEELEYKDTERIESLVIVLDTSGSCSGPVLESFLSHTLSILSEKRLFRERTQIHILQCDNQVQDDRILTKEAQIRQLLLELKNKTFKTRGYGGTDFRPAFAYVSDLIRDGKLPRLKGLLYFTDGYGIFPKEKPPYETVFVLTGEYDSSIHVPGWAVRLQLDALEMQGEKS